VTLNLDCSIAVGVDTRGWAAAVAAPVQESEDDDDNQTTSAASNSANKCTILVAARTRCSGWNDDNGRANGSSI
jgi:hypothetical protein